MRIISQKKLRLFWNDPANPNAEKPMRGWYRVAKQAKWLKFADVKATYNSADQVGSKTVFDVGGNHYRIIAVIDYVGQKVFIRSVLNHHDYAKGLWKKDTFKWVKRPRKKQG
jgi:mRNA interferase HigB